jgi:hypothetical protein
MGYRTVVILSNDQMHEWENDPMLGTKIANASGKFLTFHDCKNFQYGSIVETVHADRQSLVVLDSLSSDKITFDNWSRFDTKESVRLKLLQRAAEELGYKLVKN